MAMKWKEVSEDRYVEMLEVLWPACWEGIGFLVGEPWSHNREGQPVFAAFAKIDGAHYEAHGALSIREFRALSRADVLGNLVPAIVEG